MTVYANESGTVKNLTDYATSGGCTQIKCYQIQMNNQYNSSIGGYSGTTTASFAPKFLIGIILFTSSGSGYPSAISLATWSSSSGYTSINKYYAEVSGTTSGYNFIGLSASNKIITASTSGNVIKVLVIAMA